MLVLMIQILEKSLVDKQMTTANAIKIEIMSKNAKMKMGYLGKEEYSRGSD